MTPKLGYAYPRCALAAACWPGAEPKRPKNLMRYRLHAPEGTYITLLGQFYTEDQTQLVQADVDTIRLHVFEQPASAPASEVYSTSLTTSAVVFDTMQTDARWTGDGTGYNFRYTVDAPQLLGKGGATMIYEVEIVLLSDGGPIKQAWEVHAAPFLSPA